MQLFAFLFQKHEKYGQNQAKKGCKMVPLERLTLEHYGCEDCKDCEGNHFLDDFKLHEVEWTAVFNVSDPVCRNLGAVLKEGYSPREENDSYKRPACGNLHLLEFEMSVPCECHEYV